MPSFLVDLYVLLSARVPRPDSALLFGSITLLAYTLLAPASALFAQAGMVLPVLCALMGYIVIVADRMPTTFQRLQDLPLNKSRHFIALVPLTICVLCIFAPSLNWAQHATSVILAIYTLAFIAMTAGRDGPSKTPWFGKDWTSGQRNAANWHIARLVALVLANELVATTGSAIDWIIAISIGPIALHYIMYWTILATHPYDEINPHDIGD